MIFRETRARLLFSIVGRATLPLFAKVAQTKILPEDWRPGVHGPVWWCGRQ